MDAHALIPSESTTGPQLLFWFPQNDGTAMATSTWGFGDKALMRYRERMRPQCQQGLASQRQGRAHRCCGSASICHHAGLVALAVTSLDISKISARVFVCGYMYIPDRMKNSQCSLQKCRRAAPTSGWLKPKNSGPAMAVLGAGGRSSPAFRRDSMTALMRLWICTMYTAIFEAYLHSAAGCRT